MEVTGRTAELPRHADDARQTRHGEYVRLLSELTPSLQAAKIVERRLDRHLARRFNVFKYLRQDELGLSRMIADLLDPTGEHGQDTRFLEAMLDILPETCGRFGGLRNKSADPINVEKERCTTTGRRIDITVDIPSTTGRFCLAFENKPYASDQERQIKDYLEYLRDQYGRRFLLVYLPPFHREPDEGSLPQADRATWQGQFRIMPYTGGDASLKDWFTMCRKSCTADRVSWFLRDAESFCQQQFGESTMTTNPDTRFVHEYLSRNPIHMNAALAVHDAWRLVRVEVCQRFVEHLRDTVEDRLRTVLPDFEEALDVKCRYGRKKENATALWITRDSRVPYNDLPPGQEVCNAIWLHSEGRGRNGWYWGVGSPSPLPEMAETEKERHEELCAALKRHGLSLQHDEYDAWLQWEFLPLHYRDWDPLIPELCDECEAGGGSITTYYADGLLKIAERAIPAINEVEIVNRAGSGD